MAKINSELQMTKQKQWPYLLILYASFVWVVLYPTAITLGGTHLFDYGNIFDISSGNFSFVILSFLLNGFMYFIEFELVFWIYRCILSFKIYSFIVPADKLKVDSRVYFIMRNVIYGVFVNWCFFHPYLYNYVGLIELVVTLVMVIFYVRHLYRTYSEPIVSNFVFKYFCYPIFIFEGLNILTMIIIFS